MIKLNLTPKEQEIYNAIERYHMDRDRKLAIIDNLIYNEQIQAMWGVVGIVIVISVIYILIRLVTFPW